MKNIIRKKAITLVELLVTIVIIGIIAGFVVPNYRNMVIRAKLKQAADNLRAIQAAQNVRVVRFDQYCCRFPPACFVDCINSVLKTEISGDDFRYECLSTSLPEQYTCRARLLPLPGSHRIIVTNPGSIAPEPCCEGGDCLGVVPDC